MGWGYIRLAIFTGAFLVGLVFSNSGGHTRHSNTGGVRIVHEITEVQCTDTDFNLVRTEKRRVASSSPFTRM